MNCVSRVPDQGTTPNGFDMPFQSEAQRRLLWAKHPKIARRWAHEHPGQKDLPMHKRRSKTASLLGLLDLGGFAMKLASAALGQNLQKPVGAVAGGDTLTSTQSLSRGGAPNPAAGINPGSLPSLGTPGSQDIQQQPQQQPQSMPQAPRPANPAQGSAPGAVQGQPAQPQAQAAAPPQAPGTFKPSAVFSVPHPPSVVASHHAAITSQFTPPAPAQAPPQQSQQPKMAGLLLSLMEGRLTKEAQPPFPNALPQGGSMQGGWYVPPSFSPGQQWPSGFRAPGYAGPGTPGLPGFPAGMAGVSPGMQGGYGQPTPPPNPFQALDDKAQQIEQAFINGKINKTTYGNWQTYLQKQRGLTQKRLDLVAKNKPPVEAAAAPDFEPRGSDKPSTGPQDTYKAMQDQRAQREAEYAKRQGYQKEIDGYMSQSQDAAREAYNKKFDKTSLADAERTGITFDPDGLYRRAHLNNALGQRQELMSKEEKDAFWENEKKKLNLQDVNSFYQNQYVRPDMQRSMRAAYEAGYQDPAFAGLENNPAFQELQRKAEAGDPGAKAEMDKIRTNHMNNLDPAKLMDNPQMQLLQRTDPAKFNALMQHAQTWGQYNQDYQRYTPEWDKAQKDMAGYLAGPGSAGGAKPMSADESMGTGDGTLAGPTVIGGSKPMHIDGSTSDVMSKGAPPGTQMPPPVVSKTGPAGYQPQGIASQPGSLGTRPQTMATQPGAARPEASRPVPTAQASAPVQPVKPPGTAKPAPPIGLLGSAGAAKPSIPPPPPSPLLNGYNPTGTSFGPKPAVAGAAKPGAPSPGPIGSIKPAVKPPTIKPPTASGMGMGGGAKPSVPGGA